MQLEPKKEKVRGKKRKDTCKNYGQLLSRVDENYKCLVKKWSVHQKDVTVLVVCASDNRIKVQEAKWIRTGRIDKSNITIGYL